MPGVPYTILDEGRPTEVSAELVGGRLRLTADALERSLGWELKPEGLCRGDVCMPTASRSGLVNDDQVDLTAFAELLQRPLSVDVDERVASLGASARERAEVLKGGIAPDFRLPDLTGREWALSGFRGKKVLLVAYASW